MALVAQLSSPPRGWLQRAGRLGWVLGTYSLAFHAGCCYKEYDVLREECEGNPRLMQ